MDVRVENVVKAFGDTPALHGVSLDDQLRRAGRAARPVRARARRRCCGILAGLELPTAGRVIFGGEDALSLSVQERNVGFVFQHYALFRHMTVVRQHRLRPQVRPRPSRPPRPEIRKRVLELLELVQLVGPREALSLAALRRPAAARRARPRARHRAARAPARRAVRRARRQGPQGAAPLAARDPRPDRPHHGLRHPRPGRGARARRPRRGHEPGPDRADRHARRDLRSPGTPLRLRASSARPTRCRSASSRESSSSTIAR